MSVLADRPQPTACGLRVMALYHKRRGVQGVERIERREQRLLRLEHEMPCRTAEGNAWHTAYSTCHVQAAYSMHCSALPLRFGWSE